MTISEPTRLLSHDVARVVRVQLTMAIALVIGALIWSQASAALAGAVGVGLAILGTMVSGRSVRRATRFDGHGPAVSLAPVYMGEVQKLLIIGAGVAAGLVVFELSALFLLTGLILGQFGYVVASLLSLAGDRSI